MKIQNEKKSHWTGQLYLYGRYLNRWLSHFTKNFEIKWIVKFFRISNHACPNNLLGHFWKLQVKGNLFAPKCGQKLDWHKQQNRVCKCFIIPNFMFSMNVIFLWSLHIFLIIFWKCFVTFHQNWIWQTEGQIKKAKWHSLRLLAFKRWFEHSFRAHKIFNNSIYFKILGIVW